MQQKVKITDENAKEIGTVLRQEFLTLMNEKYLNMSPNEFCDAVKGHNFSDNGCDGCFFDVSYRDVVLTVAFERVDCGFTYTLSDHVEIYLDEPYGAHVNFYVNEEKN